MSACGQEQVSIIDLLQAKYGALGWHVGSDTHPLDGQSRCIIELFNGTICAARWSSGEVSGTWGWVLDSDHSVFFPRGTVRRWAYAEDAPKGPAPSPASRNGLSGAARHLLHLGDVQPGDRLVWRGHGGALAHGNTYTVQGLDRGQTWIVDDGGKELFLQWFEGVPLSDGRRYLIDWERQPAPKQVDEGELPCGPSAQPHVGWCPVTGQEHVFRWSRGPYGVNTVPICSVCRQTWNECYPGEVQPPDLIAANHRAKHLCDKARFLAFGKPYSNETVTDKASYVPPQTFSTVGEIVGSGGGGGYKPAVAMVGPFFTGVRAGVALEEANRLVALIDVGDRHTSIELLAGVLDLLSGWKVGPDVALAIDILRERRAGK